MHFLARLQALFTVLFHRTKKTVKLRLYFTPLGRTVSVSCGCTIPEAWASKGRKALLEMSFLIGRPLYQRKTNRLDNRVMLLCLVFVVCCTCTLFVNIQSSFSYAWNQGIFSIFSKLFIQTIIQAFFTAAPKYKQIPLELIAQGLKGFGHSYISNKSQQSKSIIFREEKHCITAKMKKMIRFMDFTCWIWLSSYWLFCASLNTLLIQFS